MRAQPVRARTSRLHLWTADRSEPELEPPPAEPRRVVQHPRALGSSLAARLAEVLERASGQPVQPAAPQLKGTDLGLRRPRGCSSAVAMFQSLCTGRAYS